MLLHPNGREYPLKITDSMYKKHLTPNIHFKTEILPCIKTKWIIKGKSLSIEEYKLQKRKANLKLQNCFPAQNQVSWNGLVLNLWN